MTRKGIFWSWARDRKSDIARRARSHRAKRLGDPTKKFENDADEARWVAEYTKETWTGLKRYLEHRHARNKDLDLCCEWKGCFIIESGMRGVQSQIGEHIHRGINAISSLEEFINDHTDLVTEHFNEPSRFHVAPELWEQLRMLRKTLNELGPEPKSEEFIGNIPTNRAVFIEQLWGALKDAGYSMRRASTIIAAGFEIAELESGSAKSRSDSIYQTIRNTER